MASSKFLLVGAMLAALATSTGAVPTIRWARDLSDPCEISSTNTACTFGFAEILRIAVITANAPSIGPPFC
jgi:hypothetical protein